MAPSEPRVPPVADPSTLDDEARELLANFEQDGEVRNIFATLIRHPKLLKRWTVFGNHVLFKSSLPAREREILILRAGWLCRCEYEWSAHAIIGRGSGLSDEEIERIADGPDAEGWSAPDAALLRAADELVEDKRISDTTWDALRGTWDVPQLLDIVFTVGQYVTVSMALNTLGVPLDDDMEGFPPSTRSGREDS